MRPATAPPPKNEGDRRGSSLFVLSTILVLAAALRFSALDFGGSGVPARPDEDAVAYTFAGMDRGQLTPALVLYGGGYFYPLRGFLRAWSAVAGSEANVEEGGEAEFARLVIARAWSASLSVAAVALAYLLGAQIGDRRAGLVAAAIFAFSALAVREAHFAKPDSAAAFAAAVFLLVATRRFARADIGAVAVGAALAFAVSVKASIDLVPPALYALARPPGTARGIEWRGLVLGGLAAAVCTLAWNPFWLTRPGDAWAAHGARGSSPPPVDRKRPE